MVVNIIFNKLFIYWRYWFIFLIIFTFGFDSFLLNILMVNTFWRERKEQWQFIIFCEENLSEVGSTGFFSKESGSKIGFSMLPSSHYDDQTVGWYVRGLGSFKRCTLFAGFLIFLNSELLSECFWRFKPNWRSQFSKFVLKHIHRFYFSAMMMKYLGQY